MIQSGRCQADSGEPTEASAEGQEVAPEAPKVAAPRRRYRGKQMLPRSSDLVRRIKDYQGLVEPIRV